MNHHAVIRITLFVCLTVLLAACGSPGTPGTPGDTDELAPTVHITSPASSSLAEYQLTGIAYDNRAVTSVTAGSGTTEPLTAELTGDRFTASMTLQPGINTLTVTATDAAGNEGQAVVDVTYEPTASGLTADRDAATYGQTIVLTGSHLGEAGSVELGGIAVEPDSWTDSEIRVTVPVMAPAGPQSLLVHTSSGSSEFELFVGVAFEGPDLEALAGQELPKGTAVRLASGTYSASGPVLLDNLSLYGQGLDRTIISLPAATTQLLVLADFGHDLVWQDLTLKVDSMFVYPSPDPALSPLAATTLLAPAELLEHALARLEHAALETASQDGTAGSFQLRNVLIEQQPGGSGLQIADSGHYTTRVNSMAGDVLFDNVTIISEAPLNVVPFGSVVIADSELSGSTTVLASLAARVSVDSSAISDNAGGTTITASRGLTLTDSLFDAAGPLLVDTHLVGAAGPTAVTGSTFNSTDSTGQNSFVFGPASSRFEGNTVHSASQLKFEINGPEAAVELINNEITSDEGINYLFPFPDSSLTMTGNTTESSYSSVFLAEAPGLNLLVSNNTFTDAGILQFDLQFELASARVSDNIITAGSAETGRGSVDVRLRSTEPFVFSENDVTFLAQGYFYFFGNGKVQIQNNSLTGSETSASALMFFQQANQELDITVTNNEFTDFSSALFLRSSPTHTAPFNAQINENHFNFAINAAPQVAEIINISAAQGPLDARNNTWGTISDAAIVQSFITYAGSDTELLVDPIRLP